VWQQVKALGIKGVYQSASSSAATPKANRPPMWWASPTSKTGQEGVELAFQRELQGRDGTRTVVRDRLGRVVEDMGDPHPSRSMAATSQLSSTPRCSSSPTSACATRCRAQGQGRQRGGAGRADRRGAGAGQLPQLQPRRARNLTGEQLRNRALTDIFEPGSTMKPFIAALALETGRSRRHADPHRAGQHH
jgi:cell division protein FtsI (penicillin-binding protein 3)